MKDGRSRRIDVTKAAILAECKRQMQGGTFRPSAVAVARGAGRSVRSVFLHWPSMEALQLDAACDKHTYEAVLHRIVDEADDVGAATADRIVRAAVLGRVMP